MPSDGETVVTPHDIYIVVGEAGEPHYAFTDEEDADAVVEHWHENLYVQGDVKEVELHSKLREDADE